MKKTIVLSLMVMTLSLNTSFCWAFEKLSGSQKQENQDQKKLTALNELQEISQHLSTIENLAEAKQIKNLSLRVESLRMKIHQLTAQKLNCRQDCKHIELEWQEAKENHLHLSQSLQEMQSTYHLFVDLHEDLTAKKKIQEEKIQEMELDVSFINWKQQKTQFNDFFYPIEIFGFLYADEKVSDEECQVLDQRWENARSEIENCEKEPGSMACEILEKSLRFQDKNLSSDLEKKVSQDKNLWSLMIPADMQRDFPFIEKDRGMNKWENKFEVIYGEDSFAQKFAKMQGQKIENKNDREENEELIIFHQGKMKARDLWTQCDLMRKKIIVKSSFLRTLDLSEGISSAVLDFAWSIYPKMKKDYGELYREKDLVRAALMASSLGAEIEKALKEDRDLDQMNKRYQDKEMNMKSLFQTYFENDSGKLKMKLYTQREQMKKTIYPDNKYKKEVVVLWSSQI